MPESKRAWETQRKQVRAQLWELLGKLPPRPKAARVEMLSREDRGDYVVEKFQFDNAAGAMVPGYMLAAEEAHIQSARHSLLPLARGRVRHRQGGAVSSQAHARAARAGLRQARLRRAGH